MKRIVGLALVVVALAFALGVWSGVRAEQTGSITIPAVLAAVLAGNLLLLIWLWRRARPGSGDAIFLPPFALLSAGILLELLPGLLWPNATTVRVAGWIASLILTTIGVVMTLQRRRRLTSRSS
jgi:membrane protein CcdC involved in cytochrome C biogenesis